MSVDNINVKQNKTRNDLVNNDYLHFLGHKISENLQMSKKLEKIDGELDSIPKFNEYDILLKYNYNIKQLKQIAKEHKLKITGNKQQLDSLRSIAVYVQKTSFYKKYLK